MEFDSQSTFMGDVIFRQEGTIGIRLTNSDPADFLWEEVIPAGTWFPNALSLLQYMAQAWTSTWGDALAVTLVTDPLDANYRKMTITPPGASGTVTNLILYVPGVWADLGLSSATHDLGAGTSVKYTDVLPCVMTPYWPLAQYDLGTENLSGYAEQAHDGTVYSTAGKAQRTVTLRAALDRGTGFDETLLWTRLWRDRWTRGRSVTLYLDRDQVPTSYAQFIYNCDILELPSTGTNIELNRMIEHRELINYTQPVEFVHRQVRLDVDRFMYNTQISQAPESLNRVMTWFRAEVGESLVMTYAGVPDPSNCSAAMWLRIRQLPGADLVISDTGWGLGGFIDACCLDSMGGIEVSNGSTNDLVEPKLGAWFLVTLNSSGGSTTYGLNGVVSTDPSILASMECVFTIGVLGGDIEVDVANLGIWAGRTMTLGEQSALVAAGKSFDYANPYGTWPGVEPTVYLCNEPSGGTVTSSSSSGVSATMDTVSTWGYLSDG